MTAGGWGNWGPAPLPRAKPTPFPAELARGPQRGGVSSNPRPDGPEYPTGGSKNDKQEKLTTCRVGGWGISSKNHKGTCTHQRKAFIQAWSKQETQRHVHAPAKSVYSSKEQARNARARARTSEKRLFKQGASKKRKGTCTHQRKAFIQATTTSGGGTKERALASGTPIGRKSGER